MIKWAYQYMRPWMFPVALEAGTAVPLFLQIARAVSDDVARGRLRAGAALPGTRTLAASLGVHRSTVVSAYAELAAQGWVSTRPGGATVVAATPPDPRPRGFSPAAGGAQGVPARPGFDLDPPATAGPAVPTREGPVLALWGGVPDLRLVPRAALGRAWRRVARGRGALLGYAEDARGDRRLRAALASLLSAARGLAATADDLVVVRGSQMALYLLARVLIRPGEVVAVESPGYAPARQAFARAGARVVPIAVDGGGIDVDALEALAARTALRAVYLTPHHQYPTTVTLTPSRRLALLRLAALRRIAVIEDDYDHEFHYDGRPVLPLASADTGGVVVYVGTLAKVLAPGLRLGYVVGPAPLLERVVAERTIVDRQGDSVLERAVAEMLEDGEISRHVRRLRRTYGQRRDVLCTALERRLGAALSHARPPGGMAVWATAAPGIDVERWQAAALRAGLLFQTGRSFSVDGGATPHLRLGFAVANERELTTAVDILARTRPRESSKKR